MDLSSYAAWRRHPCHLNVYCFLIWFSLNHLLWDVCFLPFAILIFKRLYTTWLSDQYFKVKSPASQENSNTECQLSQSECGFFRGLLPKGSWALPFFRRWARERIKGRHERKYKTAGLTFHFEFCNLYDSQIVDLIHTTSSLFHKSFLSASPTSCCSLLNIKLDSMQLFWHECRSGGSLSYSDSFCKFPSRLYFALVFPSNFSSKHQSDLTLFSFQEYRKWARCSQKGRGFIWTWNQVPVIGLLKCTISKALIWGQFPVHYILENKQFTGMTGRNLQTGMYYNSMCLRMDECSRHF